MIKKITVVLIAIIVTVTIIASAFAIYYKVKIANAPTSQEIAEAHPWTVPNDWFKTDTITLKGRIEGYDAEKLGFTSMKCSYEDVFADEENTVLVLNINEDGTFCKKFLARYPVQQVFYTTDSKVSFHSIPFFARPGETIDVTVRKGSFGQYECVYNNGSSKDAERWLRTSDKLVQQFSPLWHYEGTLEGANEVAETVWKMVMARLQELINDEGYTPMEVQLALAYAQTRFGTDYLGCIDEQASALVNYEKCDSMGRAEILDSTEWKKYKDASNYAPLRHIDFDNPLLFASQHFFFLQNRIAFARPVNAYTVLSIDSYPKQLADRLADLRGFMGDDHDNLMVQLCAYKDFALDFHAFCEDASKLVNDNMTDEQKQRFVNDWPTLDKVFPLYLDAFKHPYIRLQAEQYRERKLSPKDLATPLPDTSAAEMIKELVAKYSGRFLVIDFWGMSCGPCRAAIEQSKQTRAEIAKRDDVKLVFIAEENTAEGSDDYKEYVAKWLAGEETVCVNKADFSRLQELFGFNGIPHYEVITPDCRRVRDDLRLHGYDNFAVQFEKIKQNLSTTTNK